MANFSDKEEHLLPYKTALATPAAGCVYTIDSIPNIKNAL